MLKQFVKEIYQIWISESPSQQAAALAFCCMFSFAPIIYIALSIVGIFADEIQIGNQSYLRLQSILGEDIAGLIRDSITSLANASSGESLLVSIVSFIAILFAASGVFYQLQLSLNTIWHVPPPQRNQTMSFIRQQLFSFVMVIGMGMLGIIAVLTNLVLAWSGSLLEKMLGIGANLSFAAEISALLLVVITFAMFYKFLPETEVAWGDVWLAAVIAALLVLGAINLAGLFFQNSSLGSALQVAGAFSVLLLGFYYIAHIFLIGAIFCRVYAGLFGSRRLSSEKK